MRERALRKIGNFGRGLLTFGILTVPSVSEARPKTFSPTLNSPAAEAFFLVWRDRDENGWPGQEEPRLKNIEVCLWQPWNPPVPRGCRRTGADGYDSGTKLI